jgi:transcriptional regulator of acetoin/glycerol metabolism
MQVDFQAVSRARRDFLSAGDVRQGVVADTIERSWRRCLASGVETSFPTADEVITQQELGRKCDMHHQLLSHAQPEMVTLGEQISHTNSMVILTDDEGVILHSLGDHQFLEKSHRIAMYPGCSWHEIHRGTNAIGTALIEKSALSVHGAEHYMERHHVLSCSAVPIFGTKNQVLGTLDVTNNYSAPQQHILALVKMAAQLIENRVFLASHQCEYAIHFHARPEFVGTSWEGIALFAEDGQLVAINRSGQFQLELALDEQDLNFDDLFEVPLRRILATGRDSLITPMRLSNGARIFGKLDTQSFQSRQAIPISTPNPNEKLHHRNSSLDALDSGDALIARAISQIKLVLNRDIPILVEGETGVGKEMFARAIHESSNHHQGPWVAVNCAALPEGLIEAELFGYEEGAFTGARRKGSPGKLEQANGGTLFLDEIGDMPLSMQARLLRVLQERSVTPLGSHRSKPLNFALVSATNQKLREKVEKGEFRRDLYYRLNGLGVTLPPLRHRNDIETLLDMLLQVENSDDVRIDFEVIRLFKAHPWPGNVRQLHNVVRTALALSSGKTICKAHLPLDFLEEMDLQTYQHRDMSLDTMASEVIRAALQNHSGNVSAAARQLGISRNTLYRKLKTLGLV